MIRRLIYDLETLRLFNVNDHKTILYPTTVLGTSSALAGPVLGLNPSPSAVDVVRRLPYAMAWVWVNLLVLCINNQRRPQSVVEDAINKPWRPMPAGRLTETGAKLALIFAYAGAFTISVCFNTLIFSFELMALGWLYNDVGAGDTSPVTRNMINALGFVLFGLGASKIASGSIPMAPNQDAQHWFALLVLVIFTTMHIQDLYDQEGDRARERRTIPLLIGDQLARHSVAIPVLFSSFVAPWFWDLGLVGYGFPALGGLVIVLRLLVFRSVEEDRMTFKFWCLWITCLFILPLLKRMEHIWVEGYSC